MAQAVPGYLFHKWPLLLLTSPTLTCLLSGFHHSKNHNTKLLSDPQVEFPCCLSILEPSVMNPLAHTYNFLLCPLFWESGDGYFGAKIKGKMQKKNNIQNYPPLTGHLRTGLKFRVGSIQELRDNSCSPSLFMNFSLDQSAPTYFLTSSPRSLWEPHID